MPHGSSNNTSPQPSPSPSPPLPSNAKSYRSSISTYTAYIANLSGIDLAAFILELYENANKDGVLYDNHLQERALAKITCGTEAGSLAIAQSLINSGVRQFGEINLGPGDRYIGIKINGLEVDAKDYDLHHGRNKMEAILERMRHKKNNKNNAPCCALM